MNLYSRGWVLQIASSEGSGYFGLNIWVIILEGSPQFQAETCVFLPTGSCPDRYLLVNQTNGKQQTIMGGTPVTLTPNHTCRVHLQ